jgi:hypothetical protein
MSLRLFVPPVLRLVAVATVGHACGFMLIAQQQGTKVLALPPKLTVLDHSTYTFWQL